MPLTELNPTVALVAIDLQYGVVGLPVAPHSAEDVVARSARLAERFRAVGAPVIFMRVSQEPDGGAALRTRVDQPAGPPNLDPHWSTLVDELAVRSTDLVITKRQWGAFHGTELDTQLRRRGVTDIVLTGLVTNMGVESTARQAYEHAYNTVIVSDAISGLSVDDHDFALLRIFPKISQVDTTENVLAYLKVSPSP
jgi:nicotinamidase-related amidase